MEYPRRRTPLKKIKSIWRIVKRDRLFAATIAFLLAFSVIGTLTATLCLGMTWFGDFLSNLISDILAGVVIGGVILAWWQLSKQREEERTANKERLKTYLEYLEREVALFDNTLPTIIQRLQDSDISVFTPGMIATPIWHLVEQSRELPDLLPPRLLTELAGFYGHMHCAGVAYNLITTSLMQAGPERERLLFRRMLLHELERANQVLVNSVLLERLETEIEIVKEELTENPQETRIRTLRLEIEETEIEVQLNALRKLDEES